MSAANDIRARFKGNKIKLCAIVNAKSGRCSENCSFCAQSAKFKTSVKTYSLLPKEEIFKAAEAAEKEMLATCFSIVTSGKGVVSKKEMKDTGSALKKIKERTGLNRCVSLGILSSEQMNYLKASGLTRLHHNLETAESFFDKAKELTRAVDFKNGVLHVACLSREIAFQLKLLASRIVYALNQLICKTIIYSLSIET